MSQEKNSLTIGQVAKMMSLPVSTIRYYDKEGMIPNVVKDSNGRRKFDEENIDTLRIIECLKVSGMPLADIKQFIILVKQGDRTLFERAQLFNNLGKTLKHEMEKLEKTLKIIEYKQEYYKEALSDGTEKFVKANSYSINELYEIQ